MSFLRLSHDECRVIAAVRQRLDLTNSDLPTFRAVLSLSVADQSPQLAERILALSDGQVGVLHEHLRGGPGASARRRLSPEEWRAVAVASQCLPLAIRFARPLQRLLVRYFRDSSPGLARKIGQMTRNQFDWLLDQVRTRRRENA